MRMDWNLVRDYYAELFSAAQRDGITQKAIADRGGLSGQNLISRLLKNRGSGPTVDTLFKAIEGLGFSVPDFFAAVAEREVAALIARREAPSRSSIERQGSFDAVTAPPLSPQELRDFAARFAETLKHIAADLVAAHSQADRSVDPARSAGRSHPYRRSRKIS
jgi:transcriptional regulator with XRE-family HTH domain